MQNLHAQYHLLFEKAAPVMVALAAFIGGSCCIAPTDTVDRWTAFQFTGLGLLGTICMVFLLRKLLQSTRTGLS